MHQCNETQQRRKVLRVLGAASVASTGLLAAPWVHAAGTFRIGYVTPQTGPLAAFSEPDEIGRAHV